jgi:ligand-binding SRPBCC domain-containing protein
VPVIRVETRIKAPIELCFDLARDIDLHTRSTPGTSERAVAGVISGLIGPGESVTWEATHFGIRQRLTSAITQFDRPSHFRDSMQDGAFARFDHDHFFRENGGLTLMEDIFDYDSPLGPLGRLANLLFLERYMRRLLLTRAAIVREEAERHARAASD